MIKRFFFLLTTLFPFLAEAQSAEMADQFRSDGKIYVVISVIALIFISLVAFLIYLERKVSRIEKELPASKADATVSRH